MCKQTETHYACGHIKRTLFKACKVETLLSVFTVSNAPHGTKCIMGLEVVAVARNPGDCSHNANGHGCRALHVLQRLRDRFEEMEDELLELLERAATVEKVWKAGVLPEYDWDNVEQPECIEFIKNFLRRTRDNMQPHLNLFEKVARELHVELLKAYSLQFSEILSQQNPPTKPPGGSKLRLNISWDSKPRYTWEQQFGVPDLLLLERAFRVVEWEVRRNLTTVEEMAIKLGLDAVGWPLPKDEILQGPYSQLLRERHVQPKRISD